MNEERIYLTDYVEKMRTAYRQARAGFEIYANALVKEQENWKRELQRGWNDATQRKNDHEKHEQNERELKGRLETVVREAKAEFAEIINEANGVFDRHFRATPESIDEKGLALLNSGVLSKSELIALADEYPENYTMRKLIGGAMEKLGEKTRDEELSRAGRGLKITPNTHNQIMETVKMWAEYALRPNEIQMSAVFDKQFDQRADELKARAEGYHIPKVAPAINTGAINE